MTGLPSDPSPLAGPGALDRLAAALDGPAGTLAAVWSSGREVIPATQLRVLLIVERHGDINLSGLAAELGALPSSASRLCDRLEAAGLLVRDPGRDRRAISLRLSQDGRLLLDRLREQRRQELGRVLARMAPAAQIALLTGLLHFHEAATGDKADPSAEVSWPA
ncbi:MarR family transcriptional regulator [Thermomonospora echinospora]|nr:MarR family transcriptional regulator [Thermomonospora echinospora]